MSDPADIAAAKQVMANWMPVGDQATPQVEELGQAILRLAEANNIRICPTCGGSGRIPREEGT